MVLNEFTKYAVMDVSTTVNHNHDDLKRYIVIANELESFDKHGGDLIDLHIQKVISSLSQQKKKMEMC